MGTAETIEARASADKGRHPQAQHLFLVVAVETIPRRMLALSVSLFPFDNSQLSPRRWPGDADKRPLAPSASSPAAPPVARTQVPYRLRATKKTGFIQAGLSGEWKLMKVPGFFIFFLPPFFWLFVFILGSPLSPLSDLNGSSLSQCLFPSLLLPTKSRVESVEK